MSEQQRGQRTSTEPLVEGAELVKLAVEGWKKTVDVQQHFNDLELRVRNFAITFAAAVLGLVGWALKEGVDSVLPAGFLAIGTLGWIAFYLMDRHWYHRFLDSAVEHGRVIEHWLSTATGTEVFSLASGIKKASGIPLARRTEGLWSSVVAVFVKERKLRSHHRINVFYGGFALAFAVLAAVFYMHAAQPRSTAGQPTATTVSARSSSAMEVKATAIVAPTPTQSVDEGSDAPVCRP